MTTFITILLVLAMIGTLTVLGFGVATMLRGGDPRRSNKLMQSRVIMQALALVLLAVLMRALWRLAPSGSQQTQRAGSHAS